jgi:hypothetical protein
VNAQEGEEEKARGKRERVRRREGGKRMSTWDEEQTAIREIVECTSSVQGGEREAHRHY